MPKETSTTAHPGLADLARSLGFVLHPFPIPGDEWWDRTDADLLARLVVKHDGYEVHAFTGPTVILWSARLTSGTPAAVLAAAMAVAAEGTR